MGNGLFCLDLPIENGDFHAVCHSKVKFPEGTMRFDAVRRGHPGELQSCVEHRVNCAADFHRTKVCTHRHTVLQYATK